jgi:hypothetical protein
MYRDAFPAVVASNFRSNLSSSGFRVFPQNPQLFFSTRFLNTFFFSPWKLLVNAYNMAAHDSSAQPGFLGRQVSLCSFFPNARCLLL